jgi:hypothetical protein
VVTTTTTIGLPIIIKTLPLVLLTIRLQQKILALFMVVINGIIVSLTPMVTIMVQGQLATTITTATTEVTVTTLTPPTTIILTIVIPIMVLETTIVTVPLHHVVISIILSLFLTVALRWIGTIFSSSLRKLNWILLNYLTQSPSLPNPFT